MITLGSKDRLHVVQFGKFKPKPAITVHYPGINELTRAISCVRFSADRNSTNDWKRNRHADKVNSIALWVAAFGAEQNSCADAQTNRLSPTQRET
jgi:hypothetical protein